MLESRKANMYKLLILPMFILFATTVLAADDKVVDEINSKNALIKSFTCDVQTILSRRAVKFTSYGKLFYEKEKNLRLVAHSATDNKLTSDVGSNSGYFWVYIKRLNSNYVFYANYKDLHKTNLKPSLDPAWMHHCFCLDNIDVRRAVTQMQGKKFVVIQKQTSPARKTTVYRAITIDPKELAVTGNYLYDSDKELLTFATVTSHYTTNNGIKVPKTMETGTAGEDFTVEWTFSNYKFNAKMPSDVFKIPDFQIKKFDLSSGEKVRGVND